VKAGIAVGAGLLLAIVAFRRARGVLVPEARQDRNLRLTAVGLVALAGVVWLTRHLFT